MKNNKLNILVVLSIMTISMFLVAIPSVSAEECKCHNVGVTATVSPEKIHLGMNNVPSDILFHVTIYNSEFCDETGINLKIVEQRTGKVLYYNAEQIPLLSAREKQTFDITIPSGSLTGFDGIKGWVNEGYKVSAYQKNFYLDWIPWDNYENLFIKIKPYILDVSVSGSASPSVITPGQTLFIIANSNSNTPKSVSGQLSVTVTGQFVYETQTKNIEIYHGVSSDVFEFGTTGWTPGSYTATLKFPTQPYEENKGNNIYDIDIYVPNVP